MTDLDELNHRIRTGQSSITTLLQLLCISGIVISQRAPRTPAVISSTGFALDIVFAAVSYDFVLFNKRRLSS